MLSEIRQLACKINSDHGFNEDQFNILFSDATFHELYFQLHDVDDVSVIDQQTFFACLKAWTQYDPVSRSEGSLERLNFVDLVESITYLVCQEQDISSNHLSKILSTRGVSRKLFPILSCNKDVCSLDLIMTFILESSKSKSIETKNLDRFRLAFLKNFGQDKTEINFDEFKKMIPSKDDFFSERIFRLFDTDKSGTISTAEFCETVQQFSQEDDQSKLAFLFHIYDVNEDGKLYKENFHNVIKACINESGIKLQDDQVRSLAEVLFEDGVQEGESWMRLECFQKQIMKQEGLLENMVFMLNNWLLPDHDKENVKISHKSLKTPRPRLLRSDYYQNNKPMVFTLAGLALMIFIIIVERFVYFSNMSMLTGFTPNLFYMFSRAAGKNILALSIIIIICVLRNTITFLRNCGLGQILPLDHHIYLHKVVGCLIFFFTVIHSICHFINFAVNIQPEPVKYLQLTYQYWEDHFGSDNVFNQYNLPPGCHLADFTETSNCSSDALTVPDSVDDDVVFNDGNLTCQLCDHDSGWSYTDWMLTTRPGLFGLIGGCANPTGLGLLIIMICMFVCSLPIIRRTGHFEVFYFTHYLYVFYYILLVLHAPEFWKWFLPVGILWIGERLYRLVHMFLGRGRTVIEEGNVLPSNVTNLVIKRPQNFNFNPGDWVFVNIPR